MLVLFYKLGFFNKHLFKLKVGYPIWAYFENIFLSPLLTISKVHFFQEAKQLKIQILKIYTELFSLLIVRFSQLL